MIIEEKTVKKVWELKKLEKTEICKKRLKNRIEKSGIIKINKLGIGVSSMKKHISTILTGLALVLLGVTLVQNIELKRQISEMESNLWNRISYVENAVNGITYNIETTLREEAAFLIGDSWSFQNADIEKGMVTAILEVMPKEYHPEKTNATIVLGENEYPMVLENGAFRAEVEVPLFEVSIVDRVLFEDDGLIRAEHLGWSLSPRYDYLPIVYAHYAGGTTGRPGDKSQGMYEVDFDGELQVEVNGPENAEPIRSIHIVEMVNDEEVGRMEIPTGANGSLPGTFTYEFDNKKVSFPYGSTYAMYVEVKDGYGLIHRAWAWREKIGETGEPEEDPHWWWDGAEASIFNADGEPLAVHDEEFY